MSRPVIIRNGNKSVLNVKDKSKKYIFFGNLYHQYFSSLNILTFDISVNDYGGIVLYENNPIGVIGVPSSVTGDESIRIISIFNMTLDTPETGTSSTEYKMKNPDGSFLSHISEFTGPFWDNNNKGPTTYNPPFIDGWHDYNVLINLSDTYLKTKGIDWRTYTLSSLPNLTSNARGYSPAALAIWRYNPISYILDMSGYWYMPSMHELIEEGVNLSKIDAGFAQIKNTYNIGTGQVPCFRGVEYSPNSYYASRFIGTQSGYGGNSSKYNVYHKYNRSQYYATAADNGMAQAWCKLIKENGNWILDPNYHID